MTIEGTQATPATPEQKVSELLAVNARANQDSFVTENDIRVEDSDSAENMQADGNKTREPKGDGRAAGVDPEHELAAVDGAGAETPIDDEVTPLTNKPKDETKDKPPEGENEQIGHDEPAKFDVAAIAEKLGIEPAEVYQIEIPLGQDREPITIGQFKDHVQDLLNVDDARDALETRQAEHEAAVLRDQQETLAIINALGENLTPQLRQLASEQYQTHISQQRALMLSMVPEWSDAQRYAADRSDIFDTLTAQYPVSETQLSAQQEAVTVLMMRDLARFWRREKQMNAERKRIPKVPRRPGKQPRQATKAEAQKAQLIQQAAASSDYRDKVAAVKRVMQRNE